MDETSDNHVTNIKLQELKYASEHVAQLIDNYLLSKIGKSGDSLQNYIKEWEPNLIRMLYSYLPNIAFHIEDLKVLAIKKKMAAENESRDNVITGPWK